MELKQIVFVTVVLACMSGCLAERCPCPEEPENKLELVSADKLEDEYKKGEFVVWQCKRGNGHGNVYIECKGNGEWTKANRKCKDPLDYSHGSTAGLFCAAITIILEIIFVILATKLVRQKKADAEMEMQIMEAAKATDGGKK